MANLVPTLAVPSQKLKTTLNGQVVELAIYQLRYGMFMNVTIDGTLEIGAVVCQNRNRIIRSAYLNENVGFAGDFMWNDLEGSSDPYYTGLRTRYQLLYLSEAELAALGLAG